jgi:membrane-associated phospholipid phosphatase
MEWGPSTSPTSIPRTIRGQTDQARPNHPSYPAAHGCLSTAAATVLVAFFPRDSERLLALAAEAAEARIWAGIHYRFDIEAGQLVGRKVAKKVLERALADREP